MLYGYGVGVRGGLVGGEVGRKKKYEENNCPQSKTSQILGGGWSRKTLEISKLQTNNFTARS